jgi:putative chitinase
MLVTTEQLRKILPYNRNIEALSEALNTVLPKHNIDTKLRVAGFLGQCAVESAEFNTLQENLNYGPQSLMKTWPRLFLSVDVANQYAHQPEKIANYVYANKLGNGNTESGDGWRFRGRGAIQITGRNGYQSFADYTGMTIDDVVDYCETLEGAVESGCYYWEKNNINLAADNDNIERMTKLVNGPAMLHLQDRANYYEKAKSIL